MIILKSPRVKKTTGSAISSTIGLIKAFIRPITAPAIIRSAGEPVNLKPGTYLAAIIIAAQLAKIRNNNFIIDIIKLIVA